jgi:hypothetical protein
VAGANKQGDFSKRYYQHQINLFSDGGDCVVWSAVGATNTTDAAPPLAAVSYNLTLPSDLENRKNAVFEMSHMPTKGFLNPTTASDSCKLIDCLINELNEKFLVELGAADLPMKQSPTSECEVEEKSDYKLIFVGCSHAARMAAAADRMGVSHAVVSLSHSRITSTAIADQLADEIASSPGKVVIVYMIYDNNCFFSVADDGTRVLPVRGVDNRYGTT